MSAPIHDIPVRTITGEETTLREFAGKVLLIVNVASKCGLTPQYKGLEAIYEKYKERGFEVLGFPANDFGKQEPGTNAEIAEFCSLQYGVKFPMFEKISVKGEGQHPLYRHLTEQQPKATSHPIGSLVNTLKKVGLFSGSPQDIMWNFEKFLVDREGRVIGRFAPDVAPESQSLQVAIENALAR